MRLVKMHGKYATDGREYAKVDDEDYDSVNVYTWRVHRYKSKMKYRYYARAFIKGKQVRLHRFILNLPSEEVDHKNHDTLDNRRDNLRIATRSQNSRNKPSLIGSSSKYKGVCWHAAKSKWIAHITFDGKQHHLGIFKEEIDAAHAYDRAAIIHFGEFAVLNFPLSKNQNEIEKV